MQLLLLMIKIIVTALFSGRLESLLQRSSLGNRTGFEAEGGGHASKQLAEEIVPIMRMFKTQQQLFETFIMSKRRYCSMHFMNVLH